MKYFLTGILFLSTLNSFAANSRCDLQVTGFRESHEGIKGEAKSILKEKGFTNIQFIKRSDEFKKLVLHLGTESNFGSSKKAWIVLADETKGTTDEKYLHSREKSLFWSNELDAYLTLIMGAPTCSDLYGR